MIEESPPELPAGCYSAVGTPIRVGGALWGAMTALSPQDRPLPSGTEARMVQFTDLVGTAVANAQARADLLASRARIVSAGDESRRRIERDLHDGVQQRLVSLATAAARCRSDHAPRGWRSAPGAGQAQPWSRRRWTTCARFPAASIRRSCPRAASCRH